MGKEKFVRNPNPRNLGEIGERTITPAHYDLVQSTFGMFQERANKKEQELLKTLIYQFGKEKGIEAYQALKEGEEQYNRFLEQYIGETSIVRPKGKR